jgi:hypothetical protein
VFPKTHYGPALSLKFFVSLFVAFFVFFQFRQPVSLVGGYLVRVYWAAMPKAAIDEYGEFLRVNAMSIFSLP